MNVKSASFYGIAFLMLLAMGALSYKLFFHEQVEEEAPKTSLFSKKNQNLKLSRSRERDSSGGSVWGDPRLRVQGQSPSSASLQTQAEIENNLVNLLQLYEQGADQDFLRKIDELIKNNPDVPEYVALKGDYFYNNGQWAEAEESVHQLIQLEPHNMFARTTLGELEAIQGRHQDALATMDKVLETDPGYIDALYGYVSVTEMQGEPDAGFKKIEELYKKNASNGNTAVVYADYLRAQNRVDESEEVVMKAVASDPSNPTPARVAAMNASRRGNHREAIKYAETALARDHNPETQMRTLDILWQAAFAEKNYDKAEASLRKIKELNPDDESIDFQIEMVLEAKR